MEEIKPKQNENVLKITSYSSYLKKKSIFGTVTLFALFYIIFQIANPFATSSIGHKPVATSEVHATTTYTTQQVSAHNSNSDCWIIVSGQVYNITSLFGNHSGGDDKLISCGADSTTQFNSHTHASGVLNSYLVGAVGTPTSADITAVGQSVSKSGAQVTFVGALPTNAASGVNISVASASTSNNTAPDGLDFIKVFDITGQNGSGTTVASFGSGSTANIVLTYTGASSTDTVMYWNGTAWSSAGISNVVIDTAAGTASFTTTHFSAYAILAVSVSDTATTGTSTGSGKATDSASDPLPTSGVNLGLIALNMLLALVLAVITAFVIGKVRTYREQ